MLREIREYGLDRNDFPTLVRNLSALLRMLTLNVDSRHKTGIPTICYLTTLISFICYVYVFQVSAFWFIFFRDTEEKRVEKIITFSQCMSSTMGVIKFMGMYWNKNNLKEIIDAYLDCDSRVNPHSRMSRNIDFTLRVVKKRALVLWLVVTCNIVIYVIIRPIIITDRHSMKDYQQLWGLEPMFESPNYETTIAVITLVIPVAALAPILITIFLIIVAGYSEAQMIALKQELLNLWEEAEVDYYVHTLEMERLRVNTKIRVSVDEFVKRRLEYILKSHALNKQLVLQVESVFKNGSAIQLMLLSISLVASLLCGLENTYTQIPFAVLLVGMDCFTGQNLKNASTAFETAVYRCKWERFDKKNKKLVLMMLQSAQKTMKLSAGGVACLDYMSFIYIIKSVYSAYAALQSKPEFD